MRVNKTVRGEDTTEIEKNALSKNIDFFLNICFTRLYTIMRMYVVALMICIMINVSF